MSKIVETFVFKEYDKAIDFVNKIALISKKHNHHPDVLLQYNTVTVSSTTHDEGNIITEKDKNIMSEIKIAFDKNQN